MQEDNRASGEQSAAESNDVLEKQVIASRSRKPVKDTLCHVYSVMPAMPVKVMGQYVTLLNGSFLADPAGSLQQVVMMQHPMSWHPNMLNHMRVVTYHCWSILIRVCKLQASTPSCWTSLRHLGFDHRVAAAQVSSPVRPRWTVFLIVCPVPFHANVLITSGSRDNDPQ